MGLYNDGFGAFEVDRDGNARRTPPSRLQVDDEDLCRFDREKGILEVSMDGRSIRRVVELSGGLPIKELLVAGPMGEPVYFPDVREIRSLPRRNGSFFYSVNEPAPEQQAA